MCCIKNSDQIKDTHTLTDQRSALRKKRIGLDFRTCWSPQLSCIRYFAYLFCSSSRPLLMNRENHVNRESLRDASLSILPHTTTNGPHLPEMVHCDRDCSLRILAMSFLHSSSERRKENTHGRSTTLVSNLSNRPFLRSQFGLVLARYSCASAFSCCVSC